MKRLVDDGSGLATLLTRHADNRYVRDPAPPATVRREPAGPLTYELITPATLTIPSSLGVDGAVYAIKGATRATVCRTSDGFGTVEDGADLTALLAGQTIRFVTRTYAGYVAIAGNSGGTAGKVLFSTTFGSGWAEVLATTLGFSSLSCSVYHGGPLTTVLFAGEYSQNAGSSHKLWRSLDGGATWTNVLATVVVTPAVNAHMHYACYDPYTGRCFASAGDDSTHSTLWMSEDLGDTWAKIAGPTSGSEQGPPIPHNTWGQTRLQPTLMIPTAQRLVLVPDASEVVAGVIGLRRDDAYASYRATGAMEIWNLEWLHAIAPYSASAQFGRGPYARRENEIYVLVPEIASGTKKNHYIVASGDGGNSWHTVWGVRLHKSTANNGMYEGLVGVDQDGFMYAYVAAGNPLVHYIAKFHAPTWLA